MCIIIRRIQWAVPMLFLITFYGMLFVILKQMQPLYRRIMSRFISLSVMLLTPLELYDYIWTYGGWQCVKALYTKMLRDILYLGAFVGYAAPNTSVLVYKDRSQCHLLDYKKPGRPLVLNFGSCSLPPFMAKLAQFKKLVTDFANDVDFLTIYISEAHPANGWADRKKTYVIDSHITIKDRFAAASGLAECELPCPLLVDKLDNMANALYGAHPNKLIIVDAEGIVAYVGLQGPAGYRVEDVRAWIENFVAENKIN